MFELPKSGVLVCLRPGVDLTEDEREALDDYMVALHEALKDQPEGWVARQSGPDHKVSKHHEPTDVHSGTPDATLYLWYDVLD